MMRGILFGFLVLSLVMLLAGCTGEVVVGPPQGSSRATAVTDSYGEAFLDYPSTGISETITVRDSSSDSRLSDIQVLGITEDNDSVYVAADPTHQYHPVITSGESSSYFSKRIYMTPADQNVGVNATSYHPVHGGMLYGLAEEYGSRSYTTVGGLRNELVDLAYGYESALVVCLPEPVNTFTDELTATEVAQRANNLSTAFQAIGWQYIYTSRGYSTGESLKLWVVDPYDLRITGSGAGALDDTLLVLVAPTSDSTGDYLPGALRVEVTWDEAVDLDLHLTRNGAPIYDDVEDCFWRHLEQDWGAAYRVTDNPRLLFDNQSGYGPETIVLDEMQPDDYYTVVVDYWGNANGGTTNIPVEATVRVWTGNDATPNVFTVTGMDYGAPWNGDYKAVCDIDGATGNVIPNTRGISRNVTRAVGGKH